VNKWQRITAVLCAAVLLAALGVAGVRSGRNSPTAPRARLAARPVVPTSVPVQTSTTTTPTTTTTAPPAPVSTEPPAEAGPAEAAPPPATGGVGPFAGLGAWVDAFNFDPAHTGGNPRTSPGDVDAMAAQGVRTLYLQVSRPEDPAVPGLLIDPNLLAAFVQRAHDNGMQVVGWYLPHLGDLDDDMAHLEATLAFTGGGGFDGIGLDIEWRNSVPDHDERSARLVELSQRLRSAAGSRPVGAIVMPPVVTDVMNTSFWPNYPWRSLAPLFDAWLPMSYWTNRADDSPYRDAYRYTADNISLLRDNLGDPNAPVHAIGGIDDAASTADWQGFASACADQGAIGCSVYEWNNVSDEAWGALR
jgi:hypothetical protein